MSLRHAVLHSSLGDLTMVVDDDGLRAIWFPRHWHLDPGVDLGTRVGIASDAVLDATATQLSEYLAGERTTFTVPLAPRGDAFSERVWQLLREIPYGETTTYGSIAERLGNRHLAQRVGQVVGRNPISIIVPCHRVVGADGGLTGYAGGVERKQALLDLEQPDAAARGRLF